MVDTPVPKFVRPKRPPLRPDLSKEQDKIIRDLGLPRDRNVKIKYPIDMDEIKRNIKKKLEGLPKIKFNY